MDFKRLQYFMTVVNEGSISAAAKKLYMSQPPLSIQMKLLEEEFGCRLFIRGSRRIQLTDSGKALYSHAKNLLELGRITREDVLSHAEATGGTIRIGIVSSLVCSECAGWIFDYSREHPDIRFEITESDTYQLLGKLENQILQLAVVRSPFPPQQLTCSRLFTDSMVVIAKEGYFKHKEESVSLKSLAGSSLIVYRRWERILKKWFADEGLTFPSICLNDDARTTVHLTALGMGVGLVPESAVMGHDELDVRAIEGTGITSDINLVYPPEEGLPAYVRQFIGEILRKYK